MDYPVGERDWFIELLTSDIEALKVLATCEAQSWSETVTLYRTARYKLETLTNIDVPVSKTTTSLKILVEPTYSTSMCDKAAVLLASYKLHGQQPVSAGSYHSYLERGSKVSFHFKFEVSIN